MGHFREQQKEYDGVLKDNHDWITLNYEDSQKGIVVKNWYKKTGSIQIAEDILQAIYVPPFIFGIIQKITGLKINLAFCHKT